MPHYLMLDQGTDDPFLYAQQAILLQCEGAQIGWGKAAEELGCRTSKADNGVILGLESDQPFTDAQRARVNEILQEWIEWYIDQK